MRYGYGLNNGDFDEFVSLELNHHRSANLPLVDAFLLYNEAAPTRIVPPNRIVHLNTVNRIVRN